MTADATLAAIDEALHLWERGPDAMTWTATAQFPTLTPVQRQLARRLSATTGLDGYAAHLVVADVAACGQASPHATLLGPVASEMLTDAWRPIQIHVIASAFESVVQGVGHALHAFGKALAQALLPAGRLSRTLRHDLDLIERPRWHARRCTRCNPAGNPPRRPGKFRDGPKAERMRQRRGNKR